MFKRKPDPKIGERFGKLVVIEEIEKSTDSSKHKYKVRCDCGKEKIVSKFALCSTEIKSCGCLRLEKIKSTYKKTVGETLAKIGERFGRLTITKYINIDCKKELIRVECRCDCGTIKEYNYLNIINRHTQSCGCIKKEKTSLSRKKNIPIGSRFGKLVVLEEKRLKKDSNRLSYLCQCDCGRTKIVRATSLFKGETTSCGCFAIEQRKKAQDKKAKETDPKEGDRIGMITILEQLPIGQKEYNNGNRSFRCLCDCGREFIARKQSLLSGQTSCGCNKINILLASHILYSKESRIYPDSLKNYLLKDVELLEKKELTGNSIVVLKCKKCNKPFKIELGRICYLKTGELIRDYICSSCLGGISLQEESLYTFLLKTDLTEEKIERHNRTFLGNKKELDFLIKEFALAIEYNGAFWHSEKSGKNLYYHKQKFDICLKKKISLFSIYDIYWLNYQNIIKDLLSKRLCYNQTKIGLIDCEQLILKNEQAKSFYEKNSIIINDSFITDNDIKHLGLFYNSEIVFCLSYYTNMTKELFVKKLSFKIGFYDTNYVKMIIKILFNIEPSIQKIKVELNNDLDDICFYIKEGFVLHKASRKPTGFSPWVRRATLVYNR